VKTSFESKRKTEEIESEKDKSEKSLAVF